MSIDFHKTLSEMLSAKLDISTTNWWLNLGVDIILLLSLLVITWLVYQICYHVVASSITQWFKKSKNTWDDEFIESGIIKRLTRLIPTLILWFWVPVVLRMDMLSHWAQILFSILLIWISLSVVFSALNTILGLYERKDISKEVPLQGINQTLKILLSIGGIILGLSVIMGKSPALIFSGFGALTAMTYALISDSFKNWRGMAESGVRRIKRSININLNTIRFLEDQEIANLSQLPLLHDYMAKKKADFAQNSDSHPESERRHTNIGVYRAYLDAYLRAHPLISNDATQLVRQLQPSEKGLPLQLYLFLEDNNWVNFENIQSDLFDHFISMLPSFYLEIHQDPSGSDFKKIINQEVEGGTSYTIRVEDEK